MTYDLFIAHASGDREVAEELFEILEAKGVRCFLDSRSLGLGDDWDVALPRAQRASRATVVLVSEKCSRAFYQREEIAAAIEMARAAPELHRVIPFFISEPDVSAIPYGLRVKNGLYLTREATLGEAAERLARSMLTRPGVLIPVKALTYDIDLCMCIDLSNSLNWLVKVMKRQLLTLGYDVVSSMAEKGKAVGRLRVSVITFGPEGAPIERTPMIELPSGAATLYERALSLRLAGGGPPVSRGLEALNTAMNSDWSPGRGRRHIIGIWTDRKARPSSISDRLYERWDEMDTSAKRLLMFTPEGGIWERIAMEWDNTIWLPVNQGGGLSELEEGQMLESIVNSV